jgi:hypothetical protein
VDILKEAKLESFSCVSAIEHMALPTIEKKLRTIGEALQHAFEDKVTGKVEPSELEALLKDFQIPTANLEPTDRGMTYRLELFVFKKQPTNFRIGAFAALPADSATGKPDDDWTAITSPGTWV